MDKDLINILESDSNIEILYDRLDKGFLPLFTTSKEYETGFINYRYGNLFYDYLRGFYDTPKGEKRLLKDVKSCEIEFTKFPNKIFKENYISIFYTKLDKCVLENFWGFKNETDYRNLERIKIISTFHPLNNENLDEHWCEVLTEKTWRKRCDELNVSSDVINIIDCYFSIINEWVEEHRESLSGKRNNLISNISEFDVNNDGIPDVLEEFPDLMNLLDENQDKMMETKHIQEIVRLVIRLEKKCDLLKTLFSDVKELSTKQNFDVSEVNEMYSDLSTGLVSYQMIVISTMSMINSSINKKTVQYYREYELLESVGLFQSTWEKEVGQKLTDIDENIKTIINKISRMEQKIINSLESNSNKIIEGVNELENSLNSSLSSINRSISLNTFVKGIQTYQTYKINQNTKSLRG